MRKAILVRGRVKNRTTIVLEEPLEASHVGARVDVVVHDHKRPAAVDDGESLVVVMDRTRMDAALSGEPLDIEVVDARGKAEDEEPTESPVVVVRRKAGGSSPPPAP